MARNGGKRPSEGARRLDDHIGGVLHDLGVVGPSPAKRAEAAHRSWLWLVLAILAAMIIVALILFGVRRGGDEASTAAEGSAAAADSEPAPAQVAFTDCVATDLLDLSVVMQPEERGDRGTRTLGTLTVATTSGEPLRVWLLVDEGEEGGAQDWQDEGWQPTSRTVTAQTPLQERLSRTAYDDGGSTWRTVSAVTAARTEGACAQVAPTDAELEAGAERL